MYVLEYFVYNLKPFGIEILKNISNIQHEIQNTIKKSIEYSGQDNKLSKKTEYVNNLLKIYNLN